MALVMLANANNGNFRRTVYKTTKDGEGNEKREAEKVLTFTPNQPQELTGADLEAVKNDIGKALVYARLDDQGRARAVDNPSDALLHAMRTTNAGTPEHREAVRRLAERNAEEAEAPKDEKAAASDKGRKTR